MKKPPKLTPANLKHPKSEERSKFNGDVLRKEESFNTRVSSVSGSNKPKNVKNVTKIARQIEPYPADHMYSPTLRRAVPDPKPLTDRQRKMLRGK